MSGRPIRLRLSGLEIEVGASDARVLRGLAEIWDGFVADGPAIPAGLEVEVLPGGAVTATGPPESKRVGFAAEADGGGRFELAEGTVRVDSDGRRAAVRLSDPGGADRAWAVHNLLLPVLAWTYGLARRGALVHGATVLVDGRAFVLVGPEGSGKSTFAAQAARGGADVLGEDLAVLDGGEGRLEVVGAPYRTENATRRGPGRWPLAALLYPRHAAVAAIESVPRVLAVARLAANLPYAAAAGRADAIASRLADGVDVRELAFAPDPGFVEVLRGFAVARGRGGPGEHSRQ